MGRSRAEGSTPEGWRLAEVGEFCTYYKGGTPFQKLEYSTHGIPVLAKGDIKPFGRLEHSGTRYVSPRLAADRRFYLTRPGDVLMTTRDLTQAGNVLGLIAPVPEETTYLVNQGVNVVRFSDRVFLPYLIYWTNGHVYRQHMRSRAVGSTQIHIRKAAFMEAPLLCPPLNEQRRIAAVLGALDDKIELNRKMNRTLEEMAQAIFKSWFIDFDGVPESEMVDSELGPITKGWTAGTLADIATLNPTSWSTKKHPQHVRYVDLSNTKWGRINDVTVYPWADAPSRARQKLQTGDTIVGCVRPGNGSYALVAEEGLTGSTGFAVLRPRAAHFRSFVYLAATEPTNIARLAHLADGAAYPAVRPVVVADTQVPVPDVHSAERFESIVAPLLERIAANERESTTLAELRDTLLPKLISGELRVPEAETLAESAL